MSQPGEPATEDSARVYSNYDEILPEVFLEPASPKATAKPIAISSTPRAKHLEIVGMHESQSVPSDTGSHFQGLTLTPISRSSRSQSVPLSLDAVRISKKIIDVSDRFNEKRVKLKATRTLSDDDGAQRNPLPKRHSDIWEEWNSNRNSNVGSPV